MCSQNTFLVTCSVVCNVSFPSQIAFPSSWWVSVFLVFLLFWCFFCAVSLASALPFSPGRCRIFSEEFLSSTDHWPVLDKNSSEKTALLHRGEKVKESQKTHTQDREGSILRRSRRTPKGRQTKKKGKAKRRFFHSFFSFDQLSTHFVVLSENFR